MTSLLFTVLLALGAFPEAGTGQIWHGDYGAALLAAKQSEKPLLIMIQPGRTLSRVSSRNYHSMQLAQLLSSYELCQIDADSDYGRKVALAFKASGLPFIAIISKDGKQQIYRHAGELDNAELQTVLKTYQAGVKPVVHRVETNVMDAFGFSGGFSRGRSC